jgi:hypothetical protein
LNGGKAFSATGFTGNENGLPSSKPQGSDEVLGYGDSKSYQGFFVYNVVREDEVRTHGSDCDYNAFFAWVGATDTDNPYNRNGDKNYDPKAFSAITQSTAASASIIGAGSDTDEENGGKRNIMHSINIQHEFPLLYHLEIKENSEKYMYDDAIE